MGLNNMIDSPFISIVTVCYNSENFIGQTIESVLQQEFKDYEYIIVDGQSNDRTVDIVSSYEERFEGRLHWISEPDKGIYDAMNKGIRMSNGRIVWLVNSDDYIQGGALRKIFDIYNSFEEGEYPIVSFAYNEISLDGEFENKIFFDSDKCEWCAKRDYMGILHPATTVPREIYMRHGLYDTWYKVIADLDWFRRMLKEKVNIVFVDMVITNMRDGGCSATHYYKERIREYRYYCYKNYRFFDATIRYFRLWLQQQYGHILKKYYLM